MTVTTYSQWVADGSPWKNCQPINDFIATLQEHDYTGPGAGIGDHSHLTANPPEDHCPYSHTPWPGVQPYPYVMAIDIMGGEGLDLIWLGGKLFDDKSSNVPGTEPIKYINWTDSDNNCWHDSWMPKHTRYTSTDRGHIHVSFRTDYVTSSAMATYDPFRGESMASEWHVGSESGAFLTQGNPGYVGQQRDTALAFAWQAAQDAQKAAEAALAACNQILDLLKAGNGGGATPGNFTINLSGVATPAPE